MKTPKILLMHRIFNFFYFDAQRIPWVPEGFLFVAKLRSQSQLGYGKKNPLAPRVLSVLIRRRRENIPAVARFSLQEMKPLGFLERQNKMESKNKYAFFWFP